MDSRALEGVTTRVLGAPRGSEPGAVAGLPVRDDPAPRGLGPAIRSFWHLEPAELGELARGGHMRLTVYGPGHPVVSLGVVKAADPLSILDPAEEPPFEPSPAAALLSAVAAALAAGLKPGEVRREVERAINPNPGGPSRDHVPPPPEPGPPDPPDHSRPRRHGP